MGDVLVFVHFTFFSLNHGLNNWQRGVSKLALFGCRSAEWEATRPNNDCFLD